MLINWIISKRNPNIKKIVFVLGLYEFLERLEGKIRDGIFFCISKSDNYSVIKDVNLSLYKKSPFEVSIIQTLKNARRKIESVSMIVPKKNYLKFNSLGYFVTW